MTTPTDPQPTRLTKRWGQDGGLLSQPTGICRIPVYLATEVEAQHKQDQARIRELEQLEQFIGLQFDEQTQTYVSGMRPYLSAGKTKLEACIAAVDALRLVAATFETKFSDLTAQLAQMTRRYHEEFAVVDRVWRALGVTSYAQAGGKEIHEIVLDLKQQLAAKDAEIELLTTTNAQEISRLRAEIARLKEEDR